MCDLKGNHTTNNMGLGESQTCSSFHIAPSLGGITEALLFTNAFVCFLFLCKHSLVSNIVSFHKRLTLQLVF